MTDKSTPRSPLIASFRVEEDDIPLPTTQQLKSAKTGGEKIGFVSEKRQETAELTSQAADRREKARTDNVQIRTTPEDRKRWDDFAWERRVSKGEAFKMLLDLADKTKKK